MAEAQETKQPDTAFTPPVHGSVCWTELATKDLDAAEKFYSPLLGWELKQSQATGIDGMKYLEFHTGGKAWGGMFQMGPEFGDAPAHWTSYIAVDDVNAAALRVPELGGEVCMPPMDIPHVGRFAVIKDPSGATFSLITFVPHCA